MGTAGLWTHSMDLASELESLLSPDTDSTPAAAVWYALAFSVDCQISKENVPGLWQHVGDWCSAAEDADSALMVGMVNNGKYEEALQLANSTIDAASEHLYEMASEGASNEELFSAMSLSTHAADLVRELENLASPEATSTPKAALQASFGVLTDCDMAGDYAPGLWVLVKEDCEGAIPEQVWSLIDTGQYEQVLPLATSLRDAASSYLLRLCGSS